MVSVHFASDRHSGGYLCTYRNLNIEGFLLVMCEPQIFGLWVSSGSAKFASNG